MRAGVAVVPVDLGVHVQRVSEISERTGATTGRDRALEQPTCRGVLAGVQQRRCRVRVHDATLGVVLHEVGAAPG